jgi:hypothetical protein
MGSVVTSNTYGKNGANVGRYCSLSARRRREAGGRLSSGRERAGWIPPGAITPLSLALAHARGRERGGALASACAGKRGGAGVMWHVSIGPRGLSVELTII